MSPKLDTIGVTLQKFFNKKVETTARATQFVQRSSPLNGFTYLQASVFGFIDDPQANLDDLAGYCADLGVEISAQGFDQRINPNTVEFCQAMLSQAMVHFKNILALPLPILQQFSAVNLMDSTSLSLPDHMLAEYPGCGGDGPQASLKVQLNFEFLYGNLEHIVLRPGNEPDQAFADHLDWVGAVLVAGNRILAVGRWPALRARHAGAMQDLRESLLLHGLVNAHCHLDYTRMAGLFPPPRSFCDWVKLITTEKSQWSFSDFAQSWLAGAQMLVRTGTTTVGDIEAVPTLLPEVWHATPLRVMSFLEMTGIRGRRDPDAILAKAVDTIESLPRGRSTARLSPHAPYSTLPRLMKRRGAVARRGGDSTARTRRNTFQQDHVSASASLGPRAGQPQQVNRQLNCRSRLRSGPARRVRPRSRRSRPGAAGLGGRWRKGQVAPSASTTRCGSTAATGLRSGVNHCFDGCQLGNAGEWPQDRTTVPVLESKMWPCWMF